MRQIILDTETTGIEISAGNRLIEIGCVEMINRKFTGNHYHQYVNPQYQVEEGAYAVHGISNDFLADKPLFSDIVDDFMAYIDGAELVIHNAPFDLGFINNEFKLTGSRYQPIENYCSIIDTLDLARKKHPGQRNSLDALCRRYGIDNSHRVLHGALLDSEILADVYLLITGGQTGLALGGDDSENSAAVEPIRRLTNAAGLTQLNAQATELQSHQQYIDFLNNKSGGNCIWQPQAKLEE